MGLMWVIFIFVFSFDELFARSITNKRSTSSFDTSFFDNFHELFGFYEVPPPKSDSSLGPSNPSDVVPEPPQSSDVGTSVPQPTPSVPQPTPDVPQPTPSVPQPTPDVPQPMPAVPQPMPAIPQPMPAVPQPTIAVPQPVQPSPSVAQPSQPAPVQPPPKVAQPLQPKPVQPSLVTEAEEPVQPDPVVVQPASDPVQVPIQPLEPKLGEPVNLRNFDPVASVQPQPAEQPPFQPQQPEPLQPAVQPLVVPQSAQPPFQPQPVQPSFQPPVQPQAPHLPIQSPFHPQPVQSPPAEPSFQSPPAQPSFQSPPAQPPVQSSPVQPPVQSPPAQPPVQSPPAQPPVQSQPVQPPPAQPPVQSQPILLKPSVSQPTAPTNIQPAQPSTLDQPVPPALPNKPSAHQEWTGAPPRQPYYGPPRPYGPQPWWRRPSPIPTIPQNVNASHPSQPKYVSSDAAIPNKNKDIKVGIPNKTPDLRPARPLPPFHMEPSPFPLPREECITAQGELGECASHFSCGQQGGRPRGLCHLGHDVSSHARTCCVYPSFCGYQTNREVTYFKNPNYPNVTSHLGDCLYRVNLLPGVCQVRVDFMDFLMKPMKNGECEPENSLGVTSNDENAYIPVDRMCGIIATGDHDPLKTDIAHMYVNVDDDLPVDRPRTRRNSRKTVDFKVNINNHPTRWNLRISQIQCDGANLQAPQGCAQYYNQNKGNITSFNLLDGAYANDMDLALCIKRDPAACAIHYRIHSMGVGPTKGGAAGKTQLGYGLTCEDYLIFNGEKTAVCGSVSAGTKDIILPVKGEQGLTFRTDSIHIPKADTGFHIEYEYIHNCKGVEFYKYPTPGRRN